MNRKWYGDGTEIVTAEGKLYLDSVLDIGSRRVVGFALGDYNRSRRHSSLGMRSPIDHEHTRPPEEPGGHDLPVPVHPA